MSIVKMSKIKLVGISSRKDDILNALQRTGCVELKSTEQIGDLLLSANNTDEAIFPEYGKIKDGVEFFRESLEKAKGKDKPEELHVSYDEFMSAPALKERVYAVLDRLDQLKKRVSDGAARALKLGNLRSQLTPYSGVKEKFSDFKDTLNARVFFGLIKSEAAVRLEEYLSDKPMTEMQVLKDGAVSAISVLCLKEDEEKISDKLGELGFAASPFDFDCTADEKIASIDAELKAIDDETRGIYSSIAGKEKELRSLEIYCDYCKFLAEKQAASEKFCTTASAFVLEGYLPEEKKEDVRRAVSEVTDAVVIEFSAPQKGDSPPTLTRNGLLTRQAEFVTNMYSAPDYRETDPNKAVFFFFMLFMGLIMSDAGYGIVMIALGAILSHRSKGEGKRLWNLIAIGGVFSILFGILFNSFFGFKILRTNILPSPVPEGNGNDDLMSVLLGCLALGVVQMAVGYFIKAVNLFRNGDIAGGIFEGLVWVVFFIGFIFAVFDFIIGYLMPDAYLNMDAGVKNFFSAAALPGAIVAVGAVAVAAVTAGRKERGFGKISKGFGAVYGLINIMSDILSYARLFGLMLSGMIIAGTFNDLALGMMTGFAGYIFGALIMVVGHAFNIAMGVLGAYIHDSRLQYIEFFSKFYTGDGERFVPLGSKFDYIKLQI